MYPIHHDTRPRLAHHRFPTLIIRGAKSTPRRVFPRSGPAALAYLVSLPFRFAASNRASTAGSCVGNWQTKFSHT